MSTRVVFLLLLTGCDVRVQLGQRDGGRLDGGPSTDDASCPSLGDLPAWRRGLVVGQWVLLPRSALSDVTPSPLPRGSLEARLSGPAGMAADTRTNTLYVAASGGTGDYSGNEVYRLRLSNDAPTWELATPPSAPGDVLMNSAYGTDQRPTAAWGYYGTWFIEPIDEVLRFTAAGAWGAGDAFPTIDGWSAETQQWRAPLSHPSFPGTALPELPTAKDFSTGNVYQHFGDNHLYRWNAQRNVLEDLGPPTVGRQSFYEVSGSPLVFDPVQRQLIFFTDLTAPGSARLWSAATNEWTQRPLTGSAAARLVERSMAFYDPCWGKVVVKTNAPDELLLVDPQTLEVTAWPTTGQVPAIPLVGVHTLFQMLPRLGGYAFQSRTGSGVSFLPTR